MRNIILINIAGQDRPDLIPTITGILARHGASLLDIGQAVIHDTLSLGLMVEIASDADAVLDAVRARIGELGLHVRCTPVSAGGYADWVAGQGRSRQIITLLARRVTASHIAQVTAIIGRFGLSIERIDRLSGRVPAGEPSPRSKSCIELSVRGALSDPARLRREFLELAAQTDLDIAVQEDNVFRRNRRLIAFDMDSTLIDAEVIDELAAAAGVGDAVRAITAQAMHGEIDFAESLCRRVGLLKGLDAAVLEQIAARLALTEGAEKLIGAIHRLGYRTAILSGGFDYFGRHLQRRLGIDYVYANTLEIVDGRVTGRVLGDIVDGPRKAELLTELAAREQLSLEQVVAVGDGANDLPMLSLAGLGIAFRAKPVVRESARHALSTIGLDGILYMLGYSDRETDQELM